MMNNIDIVFCGDLIARVGVQLLDKSKRGERALNWEGMFQHFIEANTWAAAGSQTSRVTILAGERQGLLQLIR